MGEYSGSSPMGDGRNVAGSKYSGNAKQGKVELNKQEFDKVMKKYKKIKKYMNYYPDRYHYYLQTQRSRSL